MFLKLIVILLLVVVVAPLEFGVLGVRVRVIVVGFYWFFLAVFSSLFRFRHFSLDLFHRFLGIEFFLFGLGLGFFRFSPFSFSFSFFFFFFFFFFFLKWFL